MHNLAGIIVCST